MTALKGKLVAISVSDAPDRARLGLPSREVDRALFSICTVLVRAGAKIVYAGNLDPDGLTFRMFRHLAGAYASAQDRPFIHIVPEPILRNALFNGLASALREGAPVVETFIHLEDNLIPIRAVEDGVRVGKGASRLTLGGDAEFQDWLGARRVLDSVGAYTASRWATTALSDARVVLGGKMGVLDEPEDAYQGIMPGIVEEAIFALEARKPCIPLGAYGGAARDVAIALELLDASKRVPRGKQLATYEPSLERVAGLRDKIPSSLHPALAALADNDRGETMAFEVASVLTRWLNL
jgi:hypothetical protein